MERSARAVAWLVVVARASAYCGCSNAVPASETVATLERSFATRVAGRERLAQRILSLARSHASARAAGRSAPLRLHLTGPSGVGKSFLAELVANSFFEESARYTALRAARRRRRSSAASPPPRPTRRRPSAPRPCPRRRRRARPPRSRGGGGGGGGSGARRVAPRAPRPARAAPPPPPSHRWPPPSRPSPPPPRRRVVAGRAGRPRGGLLGWAAAAFGWSAGSLADDYWGVAPAPYPTQCGVAWWKFATVEDEAEGRALCKAEALRALAAAVRAVRACDRAVLVFEDVNRLPLGALRLLEPLTQPVLRSGADAVDAPKAVVVLTSDLYGGPDAGDFLLEEGMGVEDAAAVVEAQGARMWRGAPPAWWARRADAPAAKREWTGAFSYDGRVVADVAAFVRRGPADWRAHGITHFRHAVLEPELEAAARALLEKSRVRVDEAPWSAFHETAATTHVYTSSLLLRTAERRVNPNTPYERVVVDVTWDVAHLPEAVFSGDARVAVAGMSGVSWMMEGKGGAEGCGLW
ncbi:hypothetical protein JL721_6190 [Aureococcus anophagefferens]|nr:hypothetical protein JL721_6190 [Aureococcus anophagefferens]